MIKFTSHEEIKNVYDENKYDIFYENDDIKYEVRHIGSTIYCHNVEKGMGMGAIHNFNIEHFYGVEKPEPVVEETIEDNPNSEIQNEKE